MPWFLLFLFSACMAAASSLSPAILNPATGNRYVLLNAGTWQAAEAEAMALGGHLVTINDQAEEDWVYNTFVTYGGQTRLLWIGLTDAGHEGKWRWANGDAGDFRAWAPGEPNGTYGEDFVAIYYPGHHAQNLWNDWSTISADPIGLPMCGVVEIEPTLQELELIPRGANWRYLDNGSDAGTDWRALDFDDSSWNIGTAEFGYGDGGEDTVINSGTSSHFITTYFRHSFNLEDIDPAYSKLSLRLLRDDGAVVYINGIQAFRSNMPETYNNVTRALAASQNDDEISFHNILVETSLLRTGKNVVAVEVHQQSQFSSDVSFDFEMLLLANRLPSISIVSPTNGQVMGTSPLIEFRSIDDASGVRVDLHANGDLVAQAASSPRLLPLLPPGGSWLQAIATDSGGLRATSAPVFVNIGATLVATGSGWKYLDSGTDPGAAWKLQGYNDAAWPSGNAQLGYGDGDENTVVSYGTDSANKHITTYFRKSFNDSPEPSTEQLVLRCLFDDGIIVRLNGEEIYRDNMPSGPISHSTPALGNISVENIFHEILLPANVLQSGENLLAVEVHQSSGISSDISFDLELLKFRSLQPQLSALPQNELLEFSWPAWAGNYVLEISATLRESDWREYQGEISITGDNFRVQIQPVERLLFFRLRRLD